MNYSIVYYKYYAFGITQDASGVPDSQRSCLTSPGLPQGHLEMLVEVAQRVDPSDSYAAEPTCTYPVGCRYWQLEDPPI